MAKVSVVMPVYNSERFVAKAIESVLNQTFQNFELIVIDDCSHDGSWDLLKSISDPRMVLLRNEKNSGVVFSRNRGYAAAKGDFIANMDSDDICLPSRLRMQVERLNSSTEDIVGAWVSIIDESDKETGAWEPPCADADIKAALLFESAIANPTAMFRSAVLKSSDGLDPYYRFGIEDYELYSRLAIKGFRMCNLPVRLLKYRINQSGLTSNLKKHENLLEAEHSKIYARNLGALSALVSNVHLHYNLVSGEVRTKDELYALHSYLIDLTSSLKNYSTPDALERKVSDIWTHCCLRASNYILCTPTLVFGSPLFVPSKYSLMIGGKTCLRSIARLGWSTLRRMG